VVRSLRLMPSRTTGIARDLSWQLMLIELVFVAVVAVVFLGLTLMTFNRCMGRMNESPELRRYLRDAKSPRRHNRAASPCAEAVPLYPD
jgi:hypothetical protein